MKAPSKTGMVIALVLLLGSVCLWWRLPQPTPLPSLPAPADVGAQSSAASATGLVELRRESASLDPTIPLPGSTSAGALSEVQVQEVRCGLWRDLSIALYRLCLASEVLHLTGGSDAQFRQILADYIRQAAALDGLLAGAYEVSDRRAVHEVLTGGRPDEGTLFGSLTGGVPLLIRLDTATHALQFHASDPPDAAVFALRRHLIDAFNVMPVASRRKMLEADASSRAHSATPGQLDEASARLLESQLMIRSFRRLMVGWMLAEP